MKHLGAISLLFLW